MTKTTRRRSAPVTVDGRQGHTAPDLTGVYTGATTRRMSSRPARSGGVFVQAVSSEDVVGIAIAGGGGTVGIAGAVGVVVMTVNHPTHDR